MKKLTHRILAGVLAAGLLLLAGCRGGEEERITDFTGLEAENNQGNWMMNSAAFAETEDAVYFKSNFSLYRLSKATERITINCDDPACDHKNAMCSGYLGGMTTVHSFRDKLYFVDSASPETLFRLDGTEKTAYLTLDRDPDAGYSYDRIYKDRLYSFASNKQRMDVTDLSTGETVASYEDVTRYQNGFVIEDDVIYYISADLELCAMGIDGENRRVLEGDRATRLMSYGGRLYFIQNQGDDTVLISMDKDGGDRREIMGNMLYYNILNDQIFYTVLGQAGLFAMDLDGGNPRQLTGEDVADIGVFERWDKVLLILRNQEGRVLLMDGDGSNIHELEYTAYH